MRQDYYPFGAIYHAEGDDDSDYLFTGKELDEGNGLYYFGARYYDVKVGRFLTQDPVYSDFYDYNLHNDLDFSIKLNLILILMVDFLVLIGTIAYFIK